MKHLIALFLTLAMVLSMGILPAAAEPADTSAAAEEIYVFTEADNALIEADVFAEIEQVKMNAAQTCGGIGHMTEQDYAALVPQIMQKIEASATYVPGTLQRNGNFLVWQTTVGIPCCYSPRMEAELHNTDNEPSAEEIAAAEANAEAILREFDEIQGGFPSSVNIGLIQPYWESTSNYADSSFNGYSPTYKSLWQGLQTATGGQGIRYSMYNATVDNIAYTLSNCGLVAFDSHGTTDYDGWGGDYVSQANSSYLCLITNTGVTSQDTQPQQGPYGTFYHCMKGSGYAYVDGTCIGYHMTQDAPHSFLYMGICLGMATDGMEAGLRAKGVEAVWGYSQSVSFAGDIKYVKDLLNNLKAGDSLTVAAAKVKAQYGNWDPAYSNYSYSQAVANYVAFPIVVSSEDPYPGHGNVDVVQTVYSTWTLFSQYEITAVSNNEEWGTVSLSGNKITATPNYGYYVDGYQVLSGTATVTREGNVFTVDAESDCTVQINFASRDPAVVHFSVPDGVTCEEINAYVGDYITLPAPEGEPTAEGRIFNFLGWAAVPMDADSLLMPEYLDVGTSVKLTGTDITYYALYSYFVAMDGLNDDQFVRVDKDLEYWVGEYVLTYNGQYALSADKAFSGSKICTSKAVVDLEAAGAFCEDNILNNVTPEITYVIDTAPDGTYTIKMKTANYYLAMNADSDSMTTFTSSNTAKTRWIITMGPNGPVLTNAQFNRSLQYDDSAKLFKCFSGAKKALTLYRKADGDTWYTTDPRDKVLCEEHTFSDWVTEEAPTCTETGTRARFCTVCAFKETEELEALGHDYVSAVTAPTCVDAGFTTYTCSRCGDTYTGDETAALGHSFGDWTETKAPTCTEAGEKTRTCSVCGETETEAVEALGHKPAEAVKENETAPTCTEAGGYDLVVYCSVCGEKLSSEHADVEASGHAPAEAVKENETEPTCTEAGGYDLVVYCSVCGEKLSSEHADVEALGHAWDEGVVTKEPTTAEEGEMTYTCTRCGETRTEAIPVLEFQFDDVKDPEAEYYDAVYWAFYADPQITNGTSDTTFSPEKSVNRGQAVTFLWRAAGCPEPQSSENPFTDVKESKFYYTAVLWAVEQGITNGATPTTFAPNKTCNRGDILTFIYRFKGSPEVDESIEVPYTDVKPSGYYYKAMLWALEGGIDAGVSETKFAPKAECTRGAIVTFLYRTVTGQGLLK